MTLVLAAEVEPNKVVLSADSRGLDGNHQPLPDPVEKLFTRARVGILTFGDPTGLTDTRSVPRIIHEDLPAGANVDTTIDFMKKTFQACSAMHSIVGGLDTHGKTRLETINSGASRQLLQRPQQPNAVLWRGSGDGKVVCIDLYVPCDLGATLNQMRCLFLAEAAKNSAVGPPYEYLVISPE